jgi:hypothetical protein
MSCLLLRFSLKKTVLNVSQDSKAVLCESKYASEQWKHYLKYSKDTDMPECALTIP